MNCQRLACVFLLALAIETSLWDRFAVLKTQDRPRRLFGCLGLVCFLASVGCAPVKIWERGILARRCMALVPDSEELKAEQHMLAYREGSAGGYGDSGGGCGCN